MDTNIFTEKNHQPTTTILAAALGNKQYNFWQQICDSVYQQYPKASGEWNFPGQKYGWSFRIKDKKRAIIYFLPREKKFLVAFVFGQKAVEAIMQSDIAETIKLELKAARVYAEGRGIRIEVKNKNTLKDITKLIEIKLAL
jgi:hypothetical protein